jgi:ribosome-associated toxin RatA of RatAB toxin-antitoxin module
MEIRSPIDRVWDAVFDIERYPAVMENVRWVEVLGMDGDSVRHSAWSIMLKGSILEWEERDRIDRDGFEIVFAQTAGDLAVFDGKWALHELGPELTEVTFDVEFEIGIPLLADMLNPMAKRSLRDNCTEMLLGVEREALAA